MNCIKQLNSGLKMAQTQVKKGTNSIKPKLWVKWYRRWGTLPIFSWVQGARHYARGEFSTAASYYKKGLDKYPEHVAASSARFDYAYCLFRLGEWSDCLVQLESLRKDKIHIKDAYLLEAEILLHSDQNRQAVEVLEKAQDLFKQEIRISVCLAFAHVAAESHYSEILEVKKVLSSFKKDLELGDPKLSLINSALANIEIHHGDPEIGDRMLVRVLAAGDAPVEAIVLRGERYRKRGNIATARRLFQRAIEAAPHHPRPYALLAECYLSVGDPKEMYWAVQSAESACRLSQWKNKNFLKILAQAYSSINDEVSAELVSEMSIALTVSEQIDFEIHHNLERKIKSIQQLQFLN